MKTDIQKADVWKRISAWMLDIVLILVLAVGAAWLVSVVLKFDTHYDVIMEKEQHYVDVYGIDTEMTQEDIDALVGEAKENYDNYIKARNSDGDLATAYYLVITQSFSIVALGIILAYVALELIVPIIFKNGQTLGKKIFGLGVVHTNGVRLGGQAHFVRSIIGKCTIEALIPVMIVLMIYFQKIGIVGIGVLVLYVILQIFVVCSSRTRSAIHDLLSDTVVVDLASQYVFKDADELMEYKNKVHEEIVSKQDY